MLWKAFHRSYSTHRLSISQLLNDKPLGGCQVTGWIRSARKQKDMTFLNISDGSSNAHLQIVLPSSKITADMKHHSAVRVDGELKKSNHPGQELELIAQSVELVNSCEEPYPIQPRKHFTQNFVRKYPTYKAKTNSVAALLRLRNHMTQLVNQYFQQNGYIQIHTPVLTSNDCEGGGEVFKITTINAREPLQSINNANQSITAAKAPQLNNNNNQSIAQNEGEYFDKPVFLTVSGQLHLEAICNGISKVYTFNPAFRAEKGRTRRHLSEFWMIEAEVAFLEDISELMDIIESLTKDVASNLIEHHQDDMKTFGIAAKTENRIEYIRSMVATPFQRITFQQAKLIISKNSQLPKVEDDISRDHELFLCEHLKGPVFVYNWPKLYKPFYMRECEHDKDLVSCVDLLVPGTGELCGGSLREIDVAKLKSRMGEGGDLDWYVDMRAKGSAPTAGFGLGFERLIKWLINVENIRDTIPFYRSTHECQL